MPLSPRDYSRDYEGDIGQGYPLPEANQRNTNLTNTILRTAAIFMASPFVNKAVDGLLGVASRGAARGITKLAARKPSGLLARAIGSLDMPDSLGALITRTGVAQSVITKFNKGVEAMGIDRSVYSTWAKKAAMDDKRIYSSSARQASRRAFFKDRYTDYQKFRSRVWGGVGHFFSEYAKQLPGAVISDKIIEFATGNRKPKNDIAWWNLPGHATNFAGDMLKASVSYLPFYAGFKAVGSAASFAKDSIERAARYQALKSKRVVNAATGNTYNSSSTFASEVLWRAAKGTEKILSAVDTRWQRVNNAYREYKDNFKPIRKSKGFVDRVMAGAKAVSRGYREAKVDTNRSKFTYTHEEIKGSVIDYIRNPNIRGSSPTPEMIVEMLKIKNADMPINAQLGAAMKTMYSRYGRPKPGFFGSVFGLRDLKYDRSILDALNDTMTSNLDSVSKDAYSHIVANVSVGEKGIPRSSDRYFQKGVYDLGAGRAIDLSKFNPRVLLSNTIDRMNDVMTFHWNPLSPESTMQPLKMLRVVAMKNFLIGKKPDAYSWRAGNTIRVGSVDVSDMNMLQNMKKGAYKPHGATVTLGQDDTALFIRTHDDGRGSLFLHTKDGKDSPVVQLSNEYRMVKATLGDSIRRTQDIIYNIKGREGDDYLNRYDATTYEEEIEKLSNDLGISKEKAWYHVKVLRNPTAVQVRNYAQQHGGKKPFWRGTEVGAGYGGDSIITKIKNFATKFYRDDSPLVYLSTQKSPLNTLTAQQVEGGGLTYITNENFNPMTKYLNDVRGVLYDSLDKAYSMMKRKDVFDKFKDHVIDVGTSSNIKLGDLYDDTPAGRDKLITTVKNIVGDPSGSYTLPRSVVKARYALQALDTDPRAWREVMTRAQGGVELTMADELRKFVFKDHIVKRAIAESNIDYLESTLKGGASNIFSNLDPSEQTLIKAVDTLAHFESIAGSKIPRLSDIDTNAKISQYLLKGSIKEEQGLNAVNEGISYLMSRHADGSLPKLADVIMPAWSTDLPNRMSDQFAASTDSDYELVPVHKWFPFQENIDTHGIMKGISKTLFPKYAKIGDDGDMVIIGDKIPSPTLFLTEVAARVNRLGGEIGLGLNIKERTTWDAIGKGMLTKIAMPAIGIMGAYKALDTITDTNPMFAGSLKYEELILVRHRSDNLIKLIKIGDLVDKLDPIEYDAWTNHDGNIGFKKITGGIRHRREAPLVRVVLADHSDILVTTNHSLFTNSEDDLELTVPKIGADIVRCSQVPNRINIYNLTYDIGYQIGVSMHVVPDEIMNGSDESVNGLLDGLLDSCGQYVNDEFIFNIDNRELAAQLLLLLRQLGAVVRIVDSYVIGAKGITIGNITSTCDDHIENVSMIRSMELIDQDEYVYDISVDGAEKFVAGTGMIYAHNTMLDEGVTVALAEQYVKADLRSARFQDLLGVTGAAKYAEGLMPGLVSSPLTRGGIAVGPVLAGSKIGLAMGGPVGGLAGTAAGIATSMALGMGLRDLTKSREDLEDMYAGRELVPLRKGRFWEAGRCIGSKTSMIVNNRIMEAKDVSVGDLVITSDGTLTKVINIYKREHSGRVLNIYSSIDKTHPTILTDNHIIPYLSIDDDNYMIGECTTGELKVGDYVEIPIPDLSEDILSINTTDYINNYNYVIENNSIYPARVKRWSKDAPLPTKIYLNSKVGRLFGYYIANGYIDDVVELKIPTSRMDIVDDIRYICECELGINPTIRYRKYGEYIIKINSTLLGNVFMSLFNQNEFPPLFLSTTHDFKVALITALLDSNGYARDISNTILSSNYHIIVYIKHILLSLGFISSIEYSEDKYMITWGPSNDFIKYNGKMYSKVTSIMSEEYDDVVYDFEVEHESHLLQAGSFLVHNSPYVGCLTPDSLIDTNRGYVKISDINVDDMVMSINGKYNRVIDRMSRHYSGNVYKFNTTFDYSDNVYVTDEHPLLIMRSDIQWMKANEIRVGDYVVYPNRSIQIDDELDLLLDSYDVLKRAQLFLLQHGYYSSLSDNELHIEGNSILMDGYNLIRIDSIDIDHYDGDVYDIQVEGCESFCSKGATYHNSRIQYWRPHWFARLKSQYKYTPDMYGSKFEEFLYRNPLMTPFSMIADPYHWERKGYFSSPTPHTAPALSEIPFISPILSSTIGQVVKPIKTMHREELAGSFTGAGYAGGAEGVGPGFMPLKGAGDAVTSPYRPEPMGGLSSEVRHPLTSQHSMRTILSQTLYKSWVEPAGLVGFLTESTLGGLPNELDTIIEDGGYRTSYTRAYWDLEFGGVLGLCLDGDTPILTTKGRVNIKDIVPGDMVISIDGNPHTVIESKYNGQRTDMYKITTVMKSNIIATSNHRIPVYRNGIPSRIEDVEVKDLRVGDYTIYPIISNTDDIVSIDLTDYGEYVYTDKYIYYESSKEWADCYEDLEEDPSLSMDDLRIRYPDSIVRDVLYSYRHEIGPLRMQRFINITEDIAYVIGWWIASGSTWNNEIILNINDLHYANDISDIIYNILGSSISITDNSIRFSCLPLSNYLRSEFNKYIPYKYKCMNSDACRSMFRGIILGGYNTASSDLCKDVFDLGLQLGLIGNIGRSYISRCDISNGSAFIIDNKLYTKIRSIERLDTIHDVYDIEVDGLNYYIADMIGSHNSEFGRRFLPRRPASNEYWNPLQNMMPTWLPGGLENTYFQDYKTGSPFSKIPEGELRLPGWGNMAAYHVNLSMPFRASQLGKTREELVQYLTGTGPPISPESSEIMEEGTMMHRIVQEELARANLLVKAEAPVYDPYSDTSGTVDAILRDGRRTIAAEIKTVSTDKLMKLSSPINYHVSQLNFYLKELRLRQGKIIYVSRDDPSLTKTFDVTYNHGLYVKNLAAVESARAEARDILGQGLGSPGEAYSHLDRLRVLADVAPYSNEFKKELDIVNQQDKAGLLSPEEHADKISILNRRKAVVRTYDLYPRRFTLRGIASPEEDYRLMSIDENIKPASEYTLGERAIGGAWEYITHQRSPLHTKFIGRYSPLEQYERFVLYGREAAFWNAPWRDFVEPYMRGTLSTDRVDEGIIRGVQAGFLFGGPAGAAVGAGALGIYGALQGAFRFATGSTYVPGIVKRKWEVSDYFDKLEYMKAKRMYEITGMNEYVEEMGQTMTGIDPMRQGRGSFVDVARAVPNDIKPYIFAFMSETDPRERERIADRVPENVEKLLRSKWALADRDRGSAMQSAADLREANDLANYFEDHNLPGETWCLIEGHPVMLEDRVEAINNIKVGDVVVNRGHMSTVSRINKRYVDEDIMRITTHGDTVHSLDITKDHMIFTADLKEVPASDISVGDYLLIPKIKVSTLIDDLTQYRTDSYNIAIQVRMQLLSSGIGADISQEGSDYIIDVSDSKYIFTDDYIMTEVNSVESYHYSGNVYDLTIDGMHEYFPMVGLVHNCGWNPHINLEDIQVQTVQKMGMSAHDFGLGWYCIRPDQIVIDAYGNSMRAADVRVGDELLSADGSNNVVSEVHTRHAVDESLITLEVDGYNDMIIQATENHEVLIMRDHIVEYVPIGDVNPDTDLIALPAPLYEVNGSLFTDISVYRLFGYYLACGKIIDMNSIQFTFNMEDEGVIDDANKILSDNFNVDVDIDIDDGLVNINIESEAMSGLFDRFFNDNINPMIFHSPPECRLELIRGYISCRGKDYINNMMMMCRSLGMNPSIRNELLDNIDYDMNIVPYVYRKIISKCSEIYSGPVMDFTMEGDHSYSTLGMTYHNSQMRRIKYSPLLPGPIDISNPIGESITPQEAIDVSTVRNSIRSVLQQYGLKNINVMANVTPGVGSRVVVTINMDHSDLIREELNL